MSSVGETLRRERLRTGLELDRIAQETKISLRMLELIEADQFDKLPGGVFARSFVRQYARAVGLEEDEIVRELDQVLEPRPEPVREAAEIERQFHVPRVPQWSGGSGLSRSSSLPALALVVLVVLACSAAYTWWQRSRHPNPALPARAAQSVSPAPAAASPPKTAVAIPEHPSATADRVGTPAATPASAPAPADSSSGALQIALKAEEPTWVRATANGKVVFIGILQPNETKALSAAEGVTLRIGNAGGLSISLNGKPIPAVGPRGQVRTVQLSPDGGVQVVAPAKTEAAPAHPEQTQSL